MDLRMEQDIYTRIEYIGKWTIAKSGGACGRHKQLNEAERWRTEFDLSNHRGQIKRAVAGGHGRT
jgi:hypothetical protein